jgi:hypothetical protein
MQCCIICHNKVRKIIPLQTLTNNMNSCKCNPIIHKSCFHKWNKISKSCPICRKDFLDSMNFINSVENIDPPIFEYNIIYTNTIIIATIIILIDVFIIGKFFCCLIYNKINMLN